MQEHVSVSPPLWISGTDENGKLVNREVIQAALDRAAVKPPGSATTAGGANLQDLGGANLHHYNSSSSTRNINQRTSPPTPSPQSAVPVSEPIQTAEPEPIKAAPPKNLSVERQKAPEVPSIPAMPEVPAAVPAKPETAKKPYTIPIPPPRVHQSARKEFLFRFHERFGFELDVYQTDLIESLVVSRCVTMDEYLTRIWRDWSIGSDDKFLNPIGFSVWFAQNLKRRGVQAVIPFPASSPPVEKERCLQCGGVGFLAPDLFCDCDMGRDLARVATRRK